MLLIVNNDQGLNTQLMFFEVNQK